MASKRSRLKRLFGRKRSQQSKQISSEGPKLLLGSAKCINADGIPELEKGKMYFIMEIPDMLGHVVALKHLCLPLVGIDSDRFLMYDGENDWPWER